MYNESVLAETQPLTSFKIVSPERAIKHSNASGDHVLLRDKYVQILVLTANPYAVEGNAKPFCCSRLKKYLSQSSKRRRGYAEGPELCDVVWVKAVVLGGPGVAAVGGAGGEPV